MATLSARFRVIAPDTRGAGRTVHSGGTVTFDLLADDVAALIDALGLDRPLVAGFSEGGITTSVVGIRHQGSVRAIANHAGYDAFAPSVIPMVSAMMRQMLGGSPDATDADPDAAARFFSQSAEMQGIFELIRADEDSGQGKDHWKDYLRMAFHRLTQQTGYTTQDLGVIAPAGGCPPSRPRLHQPSWRRVPRSRSRPLRGAQHWRQPRRCHRGHRDRHRQQLGTVPLRLVNPRVTHCAGDRLQRLRPREQLDHHGHRRGARVAGGDDVGAPVQTHHPRPPVRHHLPARTSGPAGRPSRREVRPGRPANWRPRSTVIQPNAH